MDSPTFAQPPSRPRRPFGRLLGRPRRPLRLAAMAGAILVAIVLAFMPAIAQDAPADGSDDLVIDELAAELAAVDTTEADRAVLRPLIDALAVGSFNDKAATVGALIAAPVEGVDVVIEVLRQLEAGNLYTVSTDPTVYIGGLVGTTYTIRDVFDGSVVQSGLGSRSVTRVNTNVTLRRAVGTAIAEMTVLSPDPARRSAAAVQMLARPNIANVPILEQALAEETDAGTRAALEAALAATRLMVITGSNGPTFLVDAGEEARLADIAAVSAMSNLSTARSILAPLVSIEGAVGQAAAEAVDRINATLELWEVGRNVWFGISLGSVLFLAAIGLAITFGVAGVINMAHGEMVMIGAYTTFAVQEWFRASAPEAMDYSLLVALPLAFLVAGAMGILIERGVIRWLYGRPLETLLATWGISLILQQAVRTIFGPTNRQVDRPSWATGFFQVGQIDIQYVRLWIFIFALAVFVVLITVLRKTAFGLRMRAVTQNRRMAGSIGIPPPWIGALTFALGSGIAGIAGVALTQIDNVSPNLGQNYIVDSFMVVVFGGVGNLWGTLVGAMGLGIANKFLEPYAGAVLAKVGILVFIILFIQWRPRGLFALKGRAVE